MIFYSNFYVVNDDPLKHYSITVWYYRYECYPTDVNIDTVIVCEHWHCYCMWTLTLLLSVNIDTVIVCEHWHCYGMWTLTLLLYVNIDTVMVCEHWHCHCLWTLTLLLYVNSKFKTHTDCSLMLATIHDLNHISL